MDNIIDGPQDEPLPSTGENKWFDIGDDEGGKDNEEMEEVIVQHFLDETIENCKKRTGTSKLSPTHKEWLAWEHKVWDLQSQNFLMLICHIWWMVLLSKWTEKIWTGSLAQSLESEVSILCVFIYI